MINFHEITNKDSYTLREVDREWKKTMERLTSESSLNNVLDIGCGGGIYTSVLAELRAKKITAIDYSNIMIEAAKIQCQNYRINFQKGNAYDTDLRTAEFDLVLERALTLPPLKGQVPQPHGMEWDSEVLKRSLSLSVLNSPSVKGCIITPSCFVLYTYTGVHVPNRRCCYDHNTSFYAAFFFFFDRPLMAFEMFIAAFTSE